VLADKPAMVKVFFALWPDDAARAALAVWQAALQPHCGGRVMRAETLHVTLVFVGLVEPGKLPEIEQTAREISAQPFALALDKAQYWAHNRIVYAMPEQMPQDLRYLAERLEQRLLERGCKLEVRVYRPHVTLLRGAHWPDAMLPDLPQVRWQVQEFVLMQSMLQHYRQLARFPLGARHKDEML